MKPQRVYKVLSSINSTQRIENLPLGNFRGQQDMVSVKSRAPMDEVIGEGSMHAE